MRATITNQWAYDNMENPDYEDGPTCEACGGDEEYIDGIRDGFQGALCALEVAIEALGACGADSETIEGIKAEYARLMEVDI